MRLTFVTGNPGKLAEARHMLTGLVELDQDAAGYPEIQAESLEDVARFGLDQVGARREPPFFLEDAGLFIPGLGGFPGVFSAHAYRTIGCDGIRALLDAAPTNDRSAEFQAVIGYRDPAGADHLFHGSCAGRIGSRARGQGGFGFDPIFVPDAADGRSFAELDLAQKGALSHRGMAMRALRAHLEQP